MRSQRAYRLTVNLLEVLDGGGLDDVENSDDLVFIEFSWTTS